MQIRRQSIDPGALRHLITFRLKATPESRDKFGAPVEAYAADFTVYAAYQPIGSREFQEKWKQVAESTGRFLIRYRTDIDVANHRITFQSQDMDVTGFQQADDRGMFAYVEVKAAL